MSRSTKVALDQGRVPKGDPLPVAKVAAVMAAKKTTEWIPYCHNIPIEFVGVDFEVGDDQILVEVSVSSVARTGVEMEALTAASAAVLTLYDMLKMIDDDMEILGVKLLEKRGGKSDYGTIGPWTATVVVASDRAATGVYQDYSGAVLVEGARSMGAQVGDPIIVPDDRQSILDRVVEACSEGNDVVLVTGGTGLSDRDATPEALLPLFERELPGIAEAYRTYSQARVPTAMLSRSMAGVCGKSVVVCLPGSPSACRDALASLFPALLHAVAQIRGEVGH